MGEFDIRVRDAYIGIVLVQFCIGLEHYCSVFGAFMLMTKYG